MSYRVLNQAGLTLGHISLARAFPPGFIFIPATSAHKPSRKLWSNPEAALPNWVKRQPHTIEVGGRNG